METKRRGQHAAEQHPAQPMAPTEEGLPKEEVNTQRAGMQSLRSVHGGQFVHSEVHAGVAVHAVHADTAGATAAAGGQFARVGPPEHRQRARAYRTHKMKQR
ncbi:hypothetical protein PoB_005891400 [Plakobranchus ocellatus]|uniref:Uncharacterized protein n=1 Tax=Plakobranchus ocellatus TaxID=259542 RepID=A0AAV4CM40_9GAST|nr:hypothetical protein PoB_005891400 [Plakobranchus ocellatus]